MLRRRSSGDHRWLVLLLAGCAACCAQVAVGQSPDARHVLDRTNQIRGEQGLQPLRWDEALAAAAQKHAEAMASTQTLSHQLNGEPDVAARSSAAGAHFSAVAENIAYGYSTDAIVDQWMHSAPHRANILDPRMNAIGIALVPGHGTLWATEDFSATTPAMTPEAVEQSVSGSLQSAGLAIVPHGSPEYAAAQAACPQFEGNAGAGARFVVRWESSDLHALPAPLHDAAASRQYTRAAIAACAPTNTRNQSFATYRVAVLLF